LLVVRYNFLFSFELRAVPTLKKKKVLFYLQKSEPQGDKIRNGTHTEYLRSHPKAEVSPWGPLVNSGLTGREVDDPNHRKGSPNWQREWDIGTYLRQW
jgi:hypothetical protein